MDGNAITFHNLRLSPSSLHPAFMIVPQERQTFVKLLSTICEHLLDFSTHHTFPKFSHVVHSLMRVSPIKTTVFLVLNIKRHRLPNALRTYKIESNPHYTLANNVRSSANIGDPIYTLLIVNPALVFFNSVIRQLTNTKKRQGDKTLSCRVP